MARPKKKNKFTEFLNVRISSDAKKAMEKLPRMARGEKINELILAWAEQDQENFDDLL